MFLKFVVALVAVQLADAIHLSSGYTSVGGGPGLPLPVPVPMRPVIPPVPYTAPFGPSPYTSYGGGFVDLGVQGMFANAPQQNAEGQNAQQQAQKA